MIAYILLGLGVFLTILGLTIGLKNIETKFFNLLVAGTLGIFAFFGFFGKYNQDINSGKTQEEIKTTAKETKFNTEKISEENLALKKSHDLLVDQNLKLKAVLDQQTQKIDIEAKIRESKNIIDLKSSIRRYEELRIKFKILFSSMSKLNLVEFDNNFTKEYRYNTNLIIAEILQNSFVSENEKVYSEWQYIRNEILIFLSFYSLPNGLTTSENNVTFEITNKVKKDKFTKLDRSLTESEARLYLLEQEVLKNNGIE